MLSSYLVTMNIPINVLFFSSLYTLTVSIVLLSELIICLAADIPVSVNTCDISPCALFKRTINKICRQNVFYITIKNEKKIWKLHELWRICPNAWIYLVLIIKPSKKLIFVTSFAVEIDWLLLRMRVTKYMVFFSMIATKGRLSLTCRIMASSKTFISKIETISKNKKVAILE